MSDIPSVAAGAAMSAFSRASQTNRLLRIEFPSKDGPDARLLVNTLTAREEISRCFRFDVELLSNNARIPLKVMMGRLVTISMVREDGSLRHFNGYVAQFRFVRTDGGFAFYEMRLEPWLALAKLRTDNVVFHNQSVLDLTESTFAHYRQRRWKSRLLGEDPKLTCAIQHNESDYNHLHRRWEEFGLHYWYEHDAESHTLHLSDRSQLAEAIDASTVDGNTAEIPFRSEAGSKEDDSINEWTAVRRLGSGTNSLASFDYKNPRPLRAGESSRNLQGDVDTYEVYEDTGANGFKSWREGVDKARRRMDARDASTQLFHARGNDRCAQPRRYFKLGGHFSAEPMALRRGGFVRQSIGHRQYLILAVEHKASNNYHLGTGAPSHYENTLTCTRKDIAWRPLRHFNSEPSLYAGVMTALVVGPPGAIVHADSLGRVKVQFHWDRLGHSDDGSSAWVRVMTPAAGQQFSQIRLPRVGEEVVIQFMDGNLDYPIIIGAVYNQNQMPPWKLPDQQALSGMRSREFAGGPARGNQLVMDDTHGELQVQLRSDQQHSQLSLGSITRIEDNAGRKEARGEGFELRTDGHGVARAGKGMLITTEARSQPAASISSLNETARRISVAAQRHKTLAIAAHEHDVAHAAGDQSAVADAASIQHEEIRGATGPDAAFAELAAPHLVLASAAGIATTSAQSTHFTSASHTALTTGLNLSLVAGDSLLASVANAFRVFVHKAGMRLIAASGNVLIQAQSDDIDAIAHKVLRLISESDWVDIRGKKGIRLHGAESMIEIADKVQVFTKAPTLFHGNLETRASKSCPQQEPIAPVVTQLAQPVESEKLFVYHTIQAHASGRACADIPYTIYLGDTKLQDGLTDAGGRIKIPHEKGTPRYRVVLGNDEEFLLDIVPARSPSADGMDAHAVAAETKLESRQHDQEQQ
ncbi:MAG: type VI secretion system tip protein TssI/VgrG [Massilia sp.]